MVGIVRHAVAVLAGLFATGAVCAAPPPPVSVVTCGQVVPVAATGILSADLDCTGDVGIALGARARLELAGHTVAGDHGFGIDCAGACTVIGPGSIVGFARGIVAEHGAIQVEGPIAFANQFSGIFGRRNVQVTGSSFVGHADSAVTGTKAVKVESCSFINNSVAVSSGSTVKLIGSTITGGWIGIYARGVNAIDSTIDTTTDGTTGPDLRTLSRPRLRNSTCAGTSQKLFNYDASWGVCALD